MNDVETRAGAPPPKVRVWDLFVRISHWAVAVAFVVAFLTEDEVLLLHIWAGYVAGVFVAARLLWGVAGPKHARFTDFIYRPAKVWRYLGDLLSFRAKRYLGHSPAGGAMAMALWLGLAVTVWSGLELYAAEEGAGPLAAAEVQTAAVTMGIMAARANDREGEENNDNDREERESPWEDVHETLANLLLLLVLAHIAGVLLASLMHRENLVRAMLTGEKRGDAAP